MEDMVYTQDAIYLKVLNEIAKEEFSEEQLPLFDLKCKYSEMLQSYYEVNLLSFQLQIWSFVQRLNGL